MIFGRTVTETACSHVT